MMSSRLAALEEQEAEQRAGLVAEELQDLRDAILRVQLYDMAATDIQRMVRGMLAKMYVHRIRKGRQRKVQLFQRVGRSFMERKWLVTDTTARQNGNLRIIRWARRREGIQSPWWNKLRAGGITALAAVIIQQMVRMSLAKQAVQRRRDLLRTVQQSALKLQAQMRKYVVQKRFKAQLVEARRQRHERELAFYLKAATRMPRLERLEKRSHDMQTERLVCRLIMEERRTYKESVAAVEEEVRPWEGSPQAPTRIERERHHADFCNNRMLSTLGDDTSDSSDDSIEDEPVKLSLKPVKLIQRERARPSYLHSSLMAFEKQLDLELAAKPDASPSRLQNVKVPRRKKKQPSQLEATRAPIADRLYYGFWE